MTYDLSFLTIAFHFQDDSGTFNSNFGGKNQVRILTLPDSATTVLANFGTRLRFEKRDYRKLTMPLQSERYLAIISSPFVSTYHNCPLRHKPHFPC